MISYEIPLETPAKKNNRITLKNGKTIPSARYRQWQQVSYFLIRPKVKKIISEKCYIILIFTYGDLRRRDADNGTSSIFDLLQDCRQIEDDKWQIILAHHVFNKYEKNKPSCEIRIYTKNEKEVYIKDLVKFTELYC